MRRELEMTVIDASSAYRRRPRIYVAAFVLALVKSRAEQEQWLIELMTCAQARRLNADPEECS